MDKKPENNSILNVAEQIKTTRQDLLTSIELMLECSEIILEDNCLATNQLAKLKKENEDLMETRQRLENDYIRLREEFYKEYSKSTRLEEFYKKILKDLKEIRLRAFLSLDIESSLGELLRSNISNLSQMDNVSMSGSLSDLSIQLTPRASLATPTGDDSANTKDNSDDESDHYELSPSSSTTEAVTNESLLRQISSEISDSDSSDTISYNCHNFSFVKNKIRYQKCESCSNAIKPLAHYYQCVDCGVILDRNCYENNVTSFCGKLNMVKLERMVSLETNWIPEILKECCPLIEEKGGEKRDLYMISDEDLYKGGIILDKYLAIKKVETLKLNKLSISVLCGIVLSFMEKLQESLIPSCLFDDFVRVCSKEYGEKRSRMMMDLVDSQLNISHKKTLAFLMLHFKQMVLKNQTFGLTKEIMVKSVAHLVAKSPKNFSVLNKKFQQIWIHNVQQDIMSLLFDLPFYFWKEIIENKYEVPGTQKSVIDNSSIRSCPISVEISQFIPERSSQSSFLANVRGVLI